MYIGTHAFLPVIAITTAEIITVTFKKQRHFSGIQILLIGIAGILPDLLWPHTSLKARYNSWTHTLWFLLILLPLIYIISAKLFKKNTLLFSLSCWFASLLHIITDALSGGVSFFYPLGDVIGQYYIPYPYWIKSDFVFICVGLSLLLIRYIIVRKKITSNNFLVNLL